MKKQLGHIDYYAEDAKRGCDAARRLWEYKGSCLECPLPECLLILSDSKTGGLNESLPEVQRKNDGPE